MNIKKIIHCLFSLFIVYLLLFIAAPTTSAETEVSFPKANPGATDFSTESGNIGFWVVDLLDNVINWVLEAAGALAVLAIVYSGIMYITSAGNEETAAKAKKNLTWAIIALVIISLAILIPNWVVDAITGTTPP